MSKEKASSGTLRVILASVMSLGIGIGGYWYYENNIASASPAPTGAAAQEQAPSRIEQPAAAPIFYELEPFTFTLQDGGSSRILYVGLTVQLQDQASLDRLTRYLPIARSRIITELGQIKPSVVNERDTKDAIRAIVSQSLMQPFSPEVQRQHITDVLFTAFVVQ